MRSDRTVHVVSCHAEGEVGDVIVGGVAPPPGDTLWAQRTFLAEDRRLRDFVLNEPRGGVFRHVNLLVPPVHPAADVGFLVMEPVHTPPMSGSNSICVATVVLDTGIVPMVEPVTELVMEAPAGLVRVRAECEDGKARRITVRNVPSFVGVRSAALEVDGVGTLTVDTAYGGDTFVVVDVDELGLSVTPSAGRDLAVLGARIADAATHQLGFEHPEHPDWDHVSFCLFAGRLERDDEGGLTARSAVVVQPGKVDRSPTGTGVSARMALLHADGLLDVGETFTARSILDSTFVGRLVGTTAVAGVPAIVPEVSGRAWITGTHQLLRDPDDPWPRGYRVSDTWPGG